MSQVVQSTCPKCKRVLRIPAAWVSQAMKCKHCQQLFQAKVRTPAAVSAPTPLPGQAPLTLAPAVETAPNPFAPAAAGPSDPFGFDDAAVASPPPRRRRNAGNWWKGAALLGILLAIAGIVAAVAGPHLSGLFNNDKKDTRVADSGGKKGRAVEEEPGPKTKKTPQVEDPPQKVEPKTGPTPEPKVTPEPKKELPKPPPKDQPKKKGITTPKKETPKVAGGVFPRRALLINVSNYLLFNPLLYGSPRSGGYPGSSTATLSDLLSRPPLNVPATQITELADGARQAHPTSKGAIQAAIEDFVDTSRDQDRILVLFTGHAIDIEKEAYLVPVEGDRNDPKSLIPLSWVYDKLAKCRARQKLLILDIFRYPPARGEELPGTDAMTEDFDAKLLSPPPGVQVWTACTKDQKSIEFEAGSVFLQALCHALQERLPGIAEPTDPFPLDQLVPKVNQRLKELLDQQKIEQLSRLTGKEADGGAAYDPNQPPAPTIVLKTPTGAGGDAAGLAMVKNILEEINLFPGAKGTSRQLPLASLPPFPAKVLDEYKADYKTLKELEDMAKDKEKYPLRAAYFAAAQALKAQEIQMEEFFPNPGGGISGKVKDAILAKQKPIGLMDFELKRILKQLIAVGDKRDMETSKRWLAHYDLAVARLKERLIFVNEYNTVLALVRQDALPELKMGDSGWRIGIMGVPTKLASKESYFKDMNKEVRKSLARLAKDHANTPWALIAAREQMTALGLEWRPSRQ